MAAAITDLITQATNTSRPVPTTLTGAKSIGAPSISVGALTGWPTATAVHFIIYTIDVNGNKVAGTQTDWKGIASGTSITGLVLKAGTDNGYSIGAVVEAAPTAAWANDLQSWGTTQHDILGVHTAITATSLATTGNISTSAGTINAATVSSLQDTSIALSTYRSEYFFDFVASGGVWTGDALGSTRNASMTAIVCYINGQRITVSAVTAHTFTASKDTYIDILNTTGVGSVVYTEVANNAASPALAANSIRIGIIITGAGNIADAGSINQGETTKILPIASSIPYAVTDSIGNLICPRDPQRKVIGYRQVTSNVTTTLVSADLTGLNLNCIIPAGRKVKVTGYIGLGRLLAANNAISMGLVDVTAGANIASAQGTTNSSGDVTQVVPSATVNPSSGVRNYKATFGRSAATTANSDGSATNPNYLLVELI